MSCFGSRILSRRAKRGNISPSQINWNELLNPRRGRQKPVKGNLQHRFKIFSKISLTIGFQMKPTEHLCARTSSVKGSFREVRSKMKWTPRARQPQGLGVLWEFHNSPQMEMQPSGKRGRAPNSSYTCGHIEH